MGKELRKRYKTGGKELRKRYKTGVRMACPASSSSPDSSTKQLKKRGRAEDDEYELARKSSTSDVVYEEKKFKKPKTDPVIPETPDVQNKTGAPNPSSSSPDSPSKRKSGKLRRSEEDDHAVAQKLSFDDEDEEGSPEDTLIIKHLKQLSKMEPKLKKTESLFELLISPADSKFSDGWKEAGRGIKQLKEGLRTISKVQELLCSTYTDDDSTPEHQE